MDVETGSKQIMENLEIAQLRTEYTNELKKYHKQKLLITVMQNLNVDELKDVNVNGKKSVEKALYYVHLANYLHLENLASNILGIQSKPNDLSYTEKKALKSKVLDDLPKYYAAQLKFANTMDPFVFNPEQLNDEVIKLGQRRREIKTKLAAAKAKECNLLSECAELKFGPHQKKLAELIRCDALAQQMKAGLIKGLIQESINSQTAHAAKAISEVGHYLDEEIVKVNKNVN